MFNSQKINNDPFPYVSESGTRHANPGWLNSKYFSNRRERPEYDNNPNPLLVAFREAVEHSASGVTVPEIARDWLGQGWPKFLTEQETAHARRVLEKLVSVYG